MTCLGVPWRNRRIACLQNQRATRHYAAWPKHRRKLTWEAFKMKRMRSCFCLSAALSMSMALISTVAFADGPDALPQDAIQWVIPLGNSHGPRHSKLNQITVDNAAKL